MTKKQNLRLIALLLVCLAFSIAPQTAQAQGLPIRIYEVNTTADLYDNAPNQICAGWVGPKPWNYGPCSLRAAINEAGFAHGTSEFIHIKLPPGVYTLSLKTPPFAGSSEIYYGDLDLPKVGQLITPNEVLIEGTGGPDNPSVIDANFIDRVLELGERRKLTLRNLIIKNGLINADNDDAAVGGGIAAHDGSALFLDNVRFTNNKVDCISGSTCTSSIGGAIYSENANLSLFNVELDHNSADQGSAIYFWDGSDYADEYDFSIERSAIHHNSGELATISGTGSLFLTNSSMAENEPPEPPSEWSCNVDINEGAVWIQNSTLISASPYGNVEVGCALNIRNSILMNGLDTLSDNYKNCKAYDPLDIVSEGGNIFGDNSCSPDPTLHDLVLTRAEAKLGWLGHYGGPTPSIALLAGSPAINRISEICEITNPYVPGDLVPLATDQRGAPRNDGLCDSGAFEGAITIVQQYLPLISK
jgi:CSLREA domain-containing protein